MQNKGFLTRTRFDSLFDALKAQGFLCIGPRVHDGAIVYSEIQGFEDLPRGVHDEQAPGRYRLHRNNSPRYFGWANGAEALKPLTFSASEILWRCNKNADGLAFDPIDAEAKKLAVIGVRACDLAALDIQHRHFCEGLGDPGFQDRLSKLLLIAVHCSAPADTCFCASTGDGPAATQGFDIALHELDDGFLLQTGSDQGDLITKQLDLTPASAAQEKQANEEIDRATQSQQRHLPDIAKQKRLYEKLDHPAWQTVAERCLACGNCTAVCPTCFCHREYEQPSIDGINSQHVREWDSCFSAGHSLVHGIVLRNDTRLRYRQWLTHKFSGWHEQFGRSGCVGCGRCISWCPVGIDVTETLDTLCHD